MRILVFSFLLLALAACAATQKNSEQATFTAVEFSDLAGWQQDNPAEALAAFKLSCAALIQNPQQAKPWQEVCATANETESDNAAARAFFEKTFTPYEVAGSNGVEGLFTGYYMPELRGSLKRKGAYQTPLYVRPQDMITADLGAFKQDLKGQHLVGKVKGSHFIPYDTRSMIAEGALERRTKALVWINDPVSAFFLEVQGSGLIRLTNGQTIAVGYDGSNGSPYVAIGKVLADRNEIPRPVTMAEIRAWLSEHPLRVQEILNTNPSYVFFRPLPTPDAIGAEGVPLTQTRSLAIDRAYIKLGTPVWLNTTDAEGHSLQRLMIAQDTGGAIKGPVRGDFYWGAGDRAATEAGAMQSKGNYYALLPKHMEPHDE